jgi:plasmid maintenance system killer protein
VKLSFSSNKLAKLLNSQKDTLRIYGPDNGRRILMRLQQIADAATLAELASLPQTRVHPLIGNRAEQISVDVKHPYRLILTIDSPAPRKPDGGLDWSAITAVTVLEITDTHKP